MNTQQKQKWIEVLRSGKYKQCTGKLCAMQRAYCCLGVLCKINDIDIAEDETPNYEYIEECVYPLENQIYCDLNDYQKKTFSEIADFIEANQPTYEIT